jgi:hypothetical protein
METEGWLPVHRSTLLVPNLSHINPVHTTTSFLRHNLPKKILPDYSHFFRLCKNSISQSKIISLRSNPQPGSPGLYIYVPPSVTGAPFIPSGTGCIPIAFYNSQTKVECILSCLYTEAILT